MIIGLGTCLPRPDCNENYKTTIRKRRCVKCFSYLQQVVSNKSGLHVRRRTSGFLQQGSLPTCVLKSSLLLWWILRDRKVMAGSSPDCLLSFCIYQFSNVRGSIWLASSNADPETASAYELSCEDSQVCTRMPYFFQSKSSRFMCFPSCLNCAQSL